MRHIVLIVFATLFANLLVAQLNFKKAFIITNEQDTVYGLAEFRIDIQNMSECRFKISESDSVKTYFPGEIFGYRFIDEGRFYITKTIEITAGQKMTVFLEYLVQGIKNLYYYRDDRDYYLIDGLEGELVVLTKSPDYIKDARLVEDFKYRGALKYVFSDFSLENRKVDKAPFNREAMVKLTTDYHDKVCEDGSQCVIFETDLKKHFFAEIELSAGMGSVLQSRHFFKYIDNTEKQVAQSVVPEINLQAEFYFPRLTRNIGLFVNISAMKTEGIKSFYRTQGNIYYFHVFKYAGTSISESAGLKYRIDLGKFRPSIEAGYLRSDYLQWTSSLYSEYNWGYQTFKGLTKNTRENYQQLKDYNGFVTALRLDYMIKDTYRIFLKLSYSSAFFNDKAVVDEAANLYVDRKFYENNVGLKLGYIF